MMQSELSKLLTTNEDKRKGILFTYFVGAIWIIGVINIVQNLYFSLTIEGTIGEEYASYNLPNFSFLILMSLIWVGHRWYPLVMRHAFMSLLVIGAIFTFEIEDLSASSLVILTIPIIMAAFLIRPIYGFVYYLGIVATYSLKLQLEGYTLLDETVVPFIGLISMIIFAVVAWLIALSLERALEESRALNRELDQRVQERTQELAQALARESAMAVRNETILTSIADGVLVFDANGRVLISNPAANRLARRDLHPFSLNEVLGSIEGKATELLRGWLGGQKPENQNNVKFEWNGRTISANVAPVILPTTTGGQVGAGQVMVLRDFTREAQLERMKDVFLGTVSHELRTPMSAIKGYVSVLLQTEKASISSDGYEYLQTIDVSIKQLLKLANELIDVSRMETGEIELYREWIDLTTIISQAIKIVQQEFASRNLKLDLKVVENLPELYLDKSRILQIMLNLLSNAYKYTKEGGATVEVMQDEQWVYVAVIDTGVGMKEADQASLFGRFFRASDRVVQQAGGTGLGLSITKGLVELHGGQLAFESQYGVGTTFKIILPKQVAEAQPQALETTDSKAMTTSNLIAA
jgi:signal transduction histidine kinase